MLGIEDTRGKVPVLMELRFHSRCGVANTERKTILLSKISTIYC